MNLTAILQLLRDCSCANAIELENASPKTEHLPLVYVDETNYYRFIKTVRVLAEVYKNSKITETTRKSMIQVCLALAFFHSWICFYLRV